ncbi:ABC transporter substrate-binding protein [Halostella litorea]|uniref:ABC transporter substrate-binding protein n=1 Tax=Halostella litorea TaxID=2528831 RepID=UPI001091FCE0|nr:extracellular solute-binding protein [Halostella litorea]
MTGPPEAQPTSRRRPLLAALATGGFGSLVGCASSGDPTATSGPTETGTPVEVLHNWTSGPDRVASESFTAAFGDAHPAVATDVRTVADLSVDELVGRRIEGGDPPEVFGTVPGGNLAPFDGSLSTVEDAWVGDAADAHPPLAREACRRGGAYRAVPVAAFRVDTVYYNVDVLAAAGIDPASLSSVDGLLGAVEAVARSSVDARPFAHALVWPRSTLQLFTALLAADDPGAYRRFLSGDGGRSAVREAVSATARLLAAGDRSSGTFAEAGRRVGNGEAAAVQAGSWLSSYLRRAGFGHRNEPEGDGSWGLVGLGDAPVVRYEAFVPTADSASPDGAAAWLAFASTKAGQVAFNRPSSAAARPDPNPEDSENPAVPRGSVPPRTDVPPERFDPPLSAVALAYRDADERLPAVELTLAPGTVEALLGAVDDWLVSGESVDVDAATDALEAAVGDA